MARRARVEFAGAVYHVLDRGDRREVIFLSDEDRLLFLGTLGEACRRTGWRVHAWVLMGNHYHLMLETPEPNLVAGMHWLQTCYTTRFNRRHRLVGHLFQGRYKAVVVDPEERGYFSALSDYIHLNPVRARLIGPDERLVDYAWSSYPAYATGRRRAQWLEMGRVLGELGLEDDAAGRRMYPLRMRERAVATLSGADGMELQRLRRSCCLGGESFRERMLVLLGAPEDTGAPAVSAGEGSWAARTQRNERSHGPEAASELIAALRRFGLREEDLTGLRKRDARKLAIAQVVSSRTVADKVWLARVLQAGDPSRWSGATQRE